MVVCSLRPNESIPLDGKDILPVIIGQEVSRSLFFQSPLPSRLKKSSYTKDEQYAVINDNYKLISMDNGRSYQLYNIYEDIAETKDLSMDFPWKVRQLNNALNEWKKSCVKSADGQDYAN